MGHDLIGLRAAVAFLTRVPMGEVPKGSLRSASAWFPTVGAVIGLAVAGFYILAIEVVPAVLASVAAVTFGLFLTGGLHEDGLADTADSFGSGAHDGRALEIMRDSRLGTYGTLALILSVVWRVAAVALLDPTSALASLVLAGSFGRAGAVLLMGVSPMARPDGLGSQLHLGASPGVLVVVVLSALAIGLAAVGWWVLLGAVVVLMAVLWFRSAAKRRVGGVTGDILGACEQVIELAILTLGVWVFADGRPWWV